MNIDLSKATYKQGMGNKKLCTYFGTLDIETSVTEYDIAYSYQQGFAVFNSLTDELIAYEETRDIVKLVDNIINLSAVVEKDSRFIIFVHKLSYDITFFRQTLINRMADFYNEKPDGIYEELLTGAIDWLSFRIKNIEFRCSYKLTQMSLYTFTKTMNIANRKLLGANDYGLHYSDEELPKEYNDYMYNDTVGLGQAICKLMKLEGLTLTTLPYTATGFVRKDIMKAFKSDITAITQAKRCRPNPAEFKLWTEALSGGLSQVNKRYKNKVVIGDTKTAFIRHRDFVSHYPTVMLTKKFPMSKGIRETFDIDESTYSNIDKLTDIANKFKQLVYSDEYLIIATVDIYNYRSKQDSIRFLPPTDKIKKHISEDEYSTTYYSNKIDSNEGVIRLTLSTPDLQCLYEYAESDMILPVNVYKYKMGRLPKQIIDTIKKYFTDKSIIKEKIKSAKRNNNEALLLELSATYSRAKVKLNSCAGMMMQKPMQDSYELSIDGTQSEALKWDLSTTEKINEILDSYYGTHNKRGQMDRGRCLSLLHAVFITAYGRQELLRACNAVGWENVIYVDTDSLFYKSTPEVEARLEELNKRYRQEAIDNEAFVTFKIDDETKTSYLSYLEDEYHTITIFKAISAKRYLYYCEETGLKLVCSSIMLGTDLVEDENGNANYSYTREMEICGFDKPREITLEDAKMAFIRFKKGFQFKRCSTKVSQYVTNTPAYRNINGHTEWVENGTILKSSIVTLHDIDVRNVDDIEVLLLRHTHLDNIIVPTTLSKEEDI